MRLPILLLALVSTALAQQSSQRSARNPQALVRYNDPSGSTVNWKFFVPQNELHSAASQRTERGQRLPIQSQQPQHPQSQLIQLHEIPDRQQIQYKPYTQVQASVQQQSPIQVHPPIQTQSPIQVHPPIQTQSPIQDPVHPSVQVQASIQVQPDADQDQYRGYVQAQIPAEAQQELSQVQYRGYSQAQVPVEVQEHNQISYKQYPEASAHVKQVNPENFKPQRAYVEPSSIVYGSNYGQQYEQQSANVEVPQYEQPSLNYVQTEQKSRRDYSNRGFQGRIVYKQDLPPQQQLTQPNRVPVFIENLPAPPVPKLLFSKDMPASLQQLLQFQAYLPHSGANTMPIARPKTLFIPEQLPEDDRRGQGYRSRTYYVSNNEYQSILDGKPVHEEQRH